MRQPLRIPQTTSRYWAFRGGLDQTSPAISIDPGRCRASTNVEVGTQGGLTVVSGYERFDGRTKPSDAVYHMLGLNISGTISVGNTITGATSGATGVVIAAPDSTSRVLTKVTGTFVSGENVTVSAVVQGVTTSANEAGAASTAALNATYTNLAADQYRADIAAVPGSGNVLGVHKYNGNVYAIRNNAGGTAAVMFKESTSGWAAVNLGRELAFTSGGVTEIVAGNTVTGAISGATAVIGRVVLTSGTWAGGNAAGFFYFASQTGTFQAENLDVGASLNLATIAGNSSAITLTASGAYEMINTNFGGSSGTLRMYGVSGVHKAFEYDGTTFAFLTTGMSVDTPDHITAFKNHLFLSFGASVQHSSIGNPLSWSVVLGASELAMGEDVTNFMLVPGGTTSGALVIYTRNATRILYGNSASDWNLVNFNPEAGGLTGTAQYIGNGLVLDDRGVVQLATSQAFGNFKDADISDRVRSFVQALRSTAIASCIVREKNQYRLFFSGGDALYTTFIGGKVAGLMPISLPNPVACVCSLEGSDGIEEVYFGSTNGMVYQMEKGTSHDGEAITWSAELAYNHFGSPRQLKQFRKVVAEVAGNAYHVFSISYSLGYGSTELPEVAATSVTPSLSGTNWDSGNWDTVYWDGLTLTPSESDLDGVAENISLIFSGSSDEFEPITLNGAIVDYTTRRPLR
jgi:hypothetical protein